MDGKTGARNEIGQGPHRRGDSRSDNGEVGLIGEKQSCIHGHLFCQQGHTPIVHSDTQFRCPHLGLGTDDLKSPITPQGAQDSDGDAVDMGDRRLIFEQFRQFGQAEHAINWRSPSEGDHFATGLADEALRHLVPDAVGLADAVDAFAEEKFF